MNIIEMIQSVEQGLPYSKLAYLAKRLGISEDRLRTSLGFSATTTHRRKVSGQFKREESNQLYWLESLLDLADRVLEDPEETKDWMTSGNLALGGAVPLAYIKTAPGYEAVRTLLHQLDHGIIV